MPELDGVFWRGVKPKWENVMWKAPTREWVEREFERLYPLAGEYDYVVKEVAVWRAKKARKQRDYQRRRSLRGLTRIPG